jgi:hypothetical protein
LNRRWNQALEAIGADPTAADRWRSLGIWQKCALAWLVVALIVVAVPVAVGGSINPCEAAANAAMPKQRHSLFPQETMRDLLASRLRSEGLPACYWAVARAVAGH